MPNCKPLLPSLMLSALLALAGCSFPGVYKIDIQQGNVVTQDMIDELRPGMSKAQVRYIMGNPLITDTFHARRWDYLYSLQSGSGEKSEKRMSLYFNDSDQLIAVSGDFRLKPGKTRDEAILGSDGALLRAPADEAIGEPYPIPQAPQAHRALPADAAPPDAQQTDRAGETAPEQESADTPARIQFSDTREMQPDAPAPGSVEEQIQRELDAVQPAQEAQADAL